MKQRTLAMMTGFEQYTRKTRRAIFLAGCGKSLNRDDSPPQGLKPSLILHDLRGAKAPLYHSAAGFRDFFRSLKSRALSRTFYDRESIVDDPSAANARPRDSARSEDVCIRLEDRSEGFCRARS